VQIAAGLTGSGIQRHLEAFAAVSDHAITEESTTWPDR